MFAPLDIFRYLRFSRDVGQMYEACVVQAAADCGLSKPETDVLLFLANTPQMNTARDVCEYRGFSKAYVSKAVDRLCQRGYLTATVSVADRRVQQLTVQDAAMAVARKLQAAQQAFFEMLTGGLSQADEQAVIAVLSRISDNVQRARRG